MRPQQPVRRPAGTRQKPAETVKVILMYRSETLIICPDEVASSAPGRAAGPRSRHRHAGHNRRLVRRIRPGSAAVRTARPYPDGRGACRGQRQLSKGMQVTMDDDLIIWLTKDLLSRQLDTPLHRGMRMRPVRSRSGSCSAGRAGRFGSVTEAAGAFRRVRASKKHALGMGCIRQLSARRPAGYRGVRIRCCPGSSGAGGPCRGLVLRARIRIRAVAGIRPGWSAHADCGRRLVRPARWPDRHPCSGLAAGQPQRQQRDGGVRRGYPPCHPGTRPDMAGRQRQPPGTPAAWRLDSRASDTDPRSPCGMTGRSCAVCRQIRVVSAETRPGTVRPHLGLERL